MALTNYRLKNERSDIFMNKWQPADPEKTKGIVQIVHGLAEHSARYGELAEFLNQAGYMVYAHDHQGHGQTAGQIENIGKVSVGNAWELMLDDIRSVNQHIKSEAGQTPIYLLGHSMGSLLLRRYICDEQLDAAGVILSGTMHLPRFNLELAYLTAIFERWRVGHDNISKILSGIFLANNNKKVNKPQTEFDWLSTDEEEVAKYIEDPFCGFFSPTSFYHDLAKGLRELNDRKWQNKIPQELPIYLISGAEDPLGKYSKGVKKVYASYQELGLKNISLNIFPGARHEIFKEKNRKEIFLDVLEWLDRQSKSFSMEK